MATIEYDVTAEEAPERLAAEIARGVSHVQVRSVEGEPLLDVPGTADPGGAARQLLDAFGEYAGGGTTFVLVLERPEGDRMAPKQGRILDEPPESPEEGEPLPH
jgi:hypothetical protein